MSYDALLEDTGRFHCVAYHIIVIGESVFSCVLSSNRYNPFQDFYRKNFCVLHQKLIRRDITDGTVQAEYCVVCDERYRLF